MPVPNSYSHFNLELPPNCTLDLPIVSTFPTERLIFTPLIGSASSAPVILFIPGNPGTCLFYISFLAALQQHYPSHTIHAISYAGHGITSQTVAGSQSDFGIADSLAGQTAHKLTYITEVIAPQPRSLTLIGHSIGCYLISHLLPCLSLHHPTIATPATYFLTPFIRMKPALLSQSVPLKIVAASPLIIPLTILSATNAALSLLSPLTTPLIATFLKHLGGITETNTRTVSCALAVNKGYLRNFITLGHEEISTLPEVSVDEERGRRARVQTVRLERPSKMALLPFALLPSVGRAVTPIANTHSLHPLQIVPVHELNAVARCTQLFCLYAGGPDQWGPVGHMREMIELQEGGHMEGFGTEFEGGITHDFVRTREQIERVVEFMGKYKGEVGRVRAVAKL